MISSRYVTKAHQESYRDEGFFILESVLSADDLDLLR